MKNFEILKGILTTIITTIEKTEAEVNFFKTFKSVPSSYFDDTSRNGSHSSIRSQIFHGHVGRTKCGHIVVVTEMLVDGNVHYIERSLFNGGTKDITDQVEKVIYSGSIENCWYRWYQLTQK